MEPTDTNLGQPLSTHPGQFSAGGLGWLAAPFGVFAGAVMLYLGFEDLGAGRGEFFDSGELTALGIGLIFFLGSLQAFGTCVSRWLQRVDVYEGGFVWKRIGATRVVHRGEVTGVRLIHKSGRQGNYYKVKVSVRAGREASISGVYNAEQLANLIAAPFHPPAQTGNRAAAGDPYGAGGWTPPTAAGDPYGPGGWTPPPSGQWTPPAH